MENALQENQLKNPVLIRYFNVKNKKLLEENTLLLNLLYLHLMSDENSKSTLK